MRTVEACCTQRSTRSTVPKTTSIYLTDLTRAARDRQGMRRHVCVVRRHGGSFNTRNSRNNSCTHVWGFMIMTPHETSRRPSPCSAESLRTTLIKYCAEAARLTAVPPRPLSPPPRPRPRPRPPAATAAAAAAPAAPAAPADPAAAAAAAPVPPIPPVAAAAAAPPPSPPPSPSHRPCLLQVGGYFAMVTAWTPDRRADRMKLFAPLELVSTTEVHRHGPAAEHVMVMVKR